MNSDSDKKFDLVQTHLKLLGNIMDAIQYISDNKGNPTGVIVPIILWRKIRSEYKIPDHHIMNKDTEHQTLTLSDQDRDLFMAELNSPPLPNAALKALMSK